MAPAVASSAMPDHEPPDGSQPEDGPKVATVDTTTTPLLSAEVLALGDMLPPKEIDPVALVQVLRALHQRIPEAVQLSLREKQSLAHAANLDPAVVDSGLDLGAAWGNAKATLGSSTEEVRAEREKARQWDEAQQEFLSIARTIGDTNLKRKHRIGIFVLQIYAIIGANLRRGPAGGVAHLRSYYERMKRAILNAKKKKSRKAAKNEEPETPEK